jgi:hypothetical protein
MKTFRDYLKEEVLPSAQVVDGSIDIEKSEVRGQINATLTSVTAQPVVTPYVALQRIMKALSYFHIILPKKTYMGGDRGVEVYEVMQFGHRMGMTNDGEFVHNVPNKYFLFIQYSVMSPIGVQYTAVDPSLSSVGGMYKVSARIVDADELETRLSAAQVTVAEDHCGTDRATMSQRVAGKEHINTIDLDGSVSAKKAKDTSERKSVKKLSSGSLEEGMTRKQKDMAVRRFMSHDPKAGESILKMGKKDREEKKSFASAKKEIKQVKEEQIDEVKSGQPSFRGDSTKRARRIKTAQQKAPKDPEFWKKVDAANKKRETQIDEVSLAKASKTARLRNIGAERDAHASPYDYSPHIDVLRRKAGKTVDRIEKKHGSDAAKRVSGKMNKDTDKVWRGQMEEGRMPASVIAHKQKLANMTPEEKAKKFAGKTEQELKAMAWRHGYGKDSNEYSKHVTKKLDEKLTKGMSAADVIHDFVHSNDPKFKGKSTKERQKMALGAYYGMHPKKSKLKEKVEFDPSTEVPRNS